MKTLQVQTHFPISEKDSESEPSLEGIQPQLGKIINRCVVACRELLEL